MAGVTVVATAAIAGGMKTAAATAMMAGMASSMIMGIANAMMVGFPSAMVAGVATSGMVGVADANGTSLMARMKMNDLAIARMCVGTGDFAARRKQLRGEASRGIAGALSARPRSR